MKNKAEVKEIRRQILVFFLDDQELGLDITYVREVLRLQEIHPLPQAPDFVAGVIDLRKHIIAVLDLRKKLHLEAAHENKAKRIILCRIQTFIVGIIVDRVSEVLTLNDEDIHPTPGIIALKMPGTQLSAIARVGTRIISILDLEKILTVEEITHITGIQK